MKIPNKPIINHAIFIPDKVVGIGSSVNAWQQKAITGVASLVCQPIIDLVNPFTDKETKKYSILKTIVKVVVGTCVGVVVRKNSQNLANKIVNAGLMKQIENKNNISDKQFIDNIAMLFGIIGCCFTNFIFDMPLTQRGMNWGIKKFKLNNKKEGD